MINQNSPGLKCPRCDNTFPVSLQDLLSSRSLQCPHCLLELTLDREESKDTLNAEMAKKFG